jgi:hypothetical protein
MSEEEAIFRAREWAAERGHVLDELGFGVPFETIQGSPPPERKGWWMTVFVTGTVLCGGGPEKQLLWVNDSTGDVEWPRMPPTKQPSLWQRLFKVCPRGSLDRP